MTITVKNNNAIIKLLIGSDFKRWKSNIEFALDIANIGMVLRVDEPPKPID